MANPYIIRVSSQKGGVGKSVIAINLAAAFKALGYKTLLIDSDFSNPSIGIYLGMEDVNIGFKEVVTGKADIVRAIIPHYATGIQVLPGTITQKQFMPGKNQVESAVPKIKKLNFDFIIVDTQPGFVIPEFFRIYNEAVIVTTPEMSACLSAVKLSRLYDKTGLKHNLLVNRVKNKRYEISIGEIEELYENKVAAIVPEDENVPISLSEHVPAYILNKKSPFSKSINAFAKIYIGRSDAEEIPQKPRAKGGIFAFLARIFGR